MPLPPLAAALTLLLAAAPPAAKPAPPVAPAARPAAPAKGGTAAQPAAKEPPKDELKDRVVAIVDEDPILASDIDRVVGLGLATPKPGEADQDFRRRVLADLVDQRLRFHEIDRFGFQIVPPKEVDRHVQEIRERWKSEAELQKRLKEVGLTPEGLRQLVSRQLMVLTYVDERLGSKVFVTSEDISAYYRDTLTVELKKAGQPVPPVEQVREPIRTVLKERRLNEEIDRWTEELRKRAEILNYFDDPGKALPPIVKKIGRKSKGP